MDVPPLAMITGATGGIGRCLANRLWRRGYRLALLGRNPERLRELAQQFSDGPGCMTLALDLAGTPQFVPAITDLIESHGPIEVLINNAGYNTFAAFHELPADEHDRMIQVNYMAPATMMRAVLPEMLQRRRGWVINVASISTKIGPWGHSAYAASKAALVSLTQTLAAEHMHSNVHFSYVNPGIVDTPYYEQPAMQPLWQAVRRFAIEPDHVAKRIEGLLDRPRLELCVPRHYRVLDWITALSPTLAHRLVTRQSTPRHGLNTNGSPEAHDHRTVTDHG